MRDDLPLLLVHGVGHHEPGAIQTIVSTALRKAGVERITPNQFNWDGLFRQDRGSGRFLDDEDMTALGRAFWVSLVDWFR